MRRLAILYFFVCSVLPGRAQTLGGNAGFNFAKLPNCPQQTALGGLNLSNISSDIGLSFGNPALLRSEMNGQVLAAFNSMRGGISNYFLSGGYYAEKWKTSFSAAINYFNYGELPQTDAAGNRLGSFRPVDYVVQVTAARSYLEHWNYGLTLKWLHSGYGVYRFSALAMDAGFSYQDTVSLWQASMVILNMGAVVQQGGADAQAGELPFDMQAGITKQLAHAPVRFSLTAHHLHQFDLLYNDSSYNADNGFSGSSGSFGDKLFRHLVLAAQVLVDKRVELTLGYNYLLRKELNIGNAGNGLNGFSMGVGLLFSQWQFRYARTYYQNNSQLNHFGISLTPGPWWR